MQTHTRLRDRLISGLLVFVMIFTMIPTIVVPAEAADSYRTLQDALNDKGELTLNLTLDNVKADTDPIMSKKSSALGGHLGQYSGYGLSGFGYCGAHNKPASKNMKVKLTEANKNTDPHLVTTFFTGHTDTYRSAAYFRDSIVPIIAKHLYPGINNVDWSNFNDDQFRKATQYAIWMSMQIWSGPNAGKRMLSCDRELRWDGSKVVSGFDPNAYDIIESGDGSKNYNTEDKRLTIQAAVALRLYATYLVQIGCSYTERKPGGNSRPVEYPALQDATFYPTDQVVDFTSAGTNGKPGSIKDAYDNRFEQLNEAVYIQNINGRDYYTMYWMCSSKTQPKEYAVVTLDKNASKNIPEGTMLSQLDRDLDGEMFPEFLDHSLADQIIPANPQTGDNVSITLRTDVPIGQAYTEEVDIAPGQLDQENGGPAKFAFAGYFKVCIPVDSVEAQIDQGITDVDINFNINYHVLSYDLYVCSNLNAQQQPFVIGTTDAYFQNTGTIRWGEQSPIKGTIIVYKKDENGKALSGATFEITNADYSKSYEQTTDGSGKAVFNIDAQYLKTPAGQPTKWEVKETQPPAGHDLIDKVEIATPSAGGTPASFTFVDPGNPPPDVPEGVIMKLDAADKMPLAGAKFHIVGVDNPTDAHFVSDSFGQVMIQWTNPDKPNYLEPGSYMVTEEDPPAGYNLDSDQPSKPLELRYDPITGETWHSGPLVFLNSKKPYIELNKVDGSNNPLPGAVFEVYKDGTLIDTIDMGNSGTVQYAGPDGKGLENGHYEFKEVSAPDGYILEATVKGLMVDQTNLKDGEAAGSLTFKNHSHPGIKIIKRSDEGESLAGGVFKVWIDGTELGSYETNENGEILISEDEYGEFLDPSKDSWTVRVEEITPPPGYLLPVDTVQEVELVKGQTFAEFTFVDTKYPYIEIEKIDAETGKPLADTVFEVLIDGTSMGTFKTDADGKIRIDYEQYKRFLDEGNKDNWTVTVIEQKVTEGYNRDHVDGTKGWTQTATLKFGQNMVPFVFKDTSYRSIRVTKKDADTKWKLEGATYKLHCVSLEDPELPLIADRIETTDETGTCIFEDLPNGTYQITETKPPFGYQGTDRVETVVVSSDDPKIIEVEYENEPLTGLTIRKVDSVSHQAVPNCRFTITGHTDDGEYVEWKDMYTDANGLIVLENIKPGEYTITETAVPDGYVLDPVPRTIKVTEQHQSTIYEFENNATNMLYVLKLDSLTKLPVPGVTFSVATAGGTHIANITTGENGYATLPDLKPGSYVVKEILCPPNMILDPMPQTFEVKEDDSGKIYELVFYNNEKTNLLIQKIDAETGKPLEGAYFDIRKGDGTEVAMNERTDENGIILLPNLDPGIYILEEVRAPEGYVLTPGEQRLVLEANKTKRVILENGKKGGITIAKVDADTNKPLPGASFELYSLEDQLLGTYHDEDKDGYIHISNMEPGQYFIKEIKAPNGYILNSAPIKVRVEEFKVTTVEVENSQKSLLTINKIDALTRVPLAEAGIRVMSMAGEVLFEGKTDESGQLLVPGLTPGWYKVQEYEAPAGYILNDQIFTVEIKEGQPSSIEIKNTAENGLLLKKVDAETMKPLADAHFEIYTLDDKFIGEFVTDSSGTINTTQLAPGHYKIKEVKAPEGYLLDDHWEYFEMVEGETTMLRFKNFKRPAILIEKLDSVTGDRLAGAVFEVKTADGKRVIGTYTTDSTGMVWTIPVDPGAYTVEEIKAPEGYTLNEEIIPVNVEAGRMPEVVRFYNDKMENVIVKKTDAETGEPLAGAVFRLYDMDGTALGDFTTGIDGLAILPQLDAGSYAIKEVTAPKGYMIDNACKVTFVVEAGKPQIIPFTDTKRPGLEVIKVDSATGDPLAGATFELYSMDGTMIDRRTTDESGILIFTDLKPGSYALRESKAPDGYKTDKEGSIVQIKAGATAIIEITNTPYSNLNLKKTDENGNPLAGAVFTVTRKSDNKVIGRFTTDATGCLTVEKLEPGDYLVTEVQAPEGYVIDTESKTVTISKGEQSYVSFINRKLTGIQISKVDANTKKPLAGAVFEVHDDNSTLIGTYTTDRNGLANTKELAPGRYTVTETKAPQGYKLPDEPTQTVTVKTGEKALVTFEDVPMLRAVIQKVDADTQKPLAGAEFQLSTTRGEVVGTGVTGADGMLTFEELSGGYYVLMETKSPNGYEKNTMPKLLYLTPSNQTTTVVVENHASSGLSIFKVDAQTKVPLAGATFEVLDHSGAVVATGTTDASGMFQTTALASGTYTVRETKAPAGYILNETAQRVQIEAGKSASVTFENQSQASLTIRKVSATTGDPLPGASFEVRAIDGSIYRTVTTDATGLAFVPGLTEGAYSIKEIKAPEGYVINGDHVDINVVAGQDNVVTVEDYQQGGLVIRKVDKQTGKLLQGAKFQVESSDGNIAYTGVTDGSGIILTGPLDAGVYTVREISAPEGYQLDSEPQTVEVKLDETRTVEFQDSPLTSLLVEKVDSITRDTLSGARFKVTRVADNKVITEGVTDVDGLMLVRDLEPGRYLVEEIQAPEGYIMETDPMTVDVVMGQVAHATFLNTPMVGIIIDSIDKDTKDPLDGSTFEIWEQNGEKLYTLTTDSTGRVQTPSLEPGYYVIKQTVVKDGYRVVLDEQTVEITAGNKPVYVTFEAVHGYSLKIENVDANDRHVTIRDAEFKVSKIDGTVIGTYLTDVNGQIMVPGLEPGWYVVTQTVPGKGYALVTESFNVEVKVGTVASVLVRSTPMTGLIIKVYDQETNLPLAGASFEVSHQNGNVVGTYTSDKTGHIETDILTEGYYVIKQIKAPDGYLPAADQTIHLTLHASSTVTFYNQPKSNIVIRYEDSSTGAGVAGAVFEIQEQNGAYIGEFITEQGGMIGSIALDPGFYTIRLKAAPDGYVFKTETQTIEVKTGSPVTAVFRGTAAAGLTISLHDEYNQPLEGGEFEVLRMDDTLVGTYTTEADGTVSIFDLADGFYFVKQIKAPSGYNLDTSEKKVELKPGQAADAVFTNTKQTGVVIYINDTSAEPIPGVRFEIRQQNGAVIGTYTSDSTGMINAPAMAPGYYVIKILSLPDGYSVENMEQTVEVTADATIRLTFDVVSHGNIKIHLTDANTGAAIQGAAFQVAKMDGGVIGEYVTDHAGYANSDSLVPGWYVVTQTKAADGYTLSGISPKNVEVVSGKASPVEFTNGSQSTLQVMAVDANGTGLAGMKVSISKMNGERVGEIVTEQNGLATMNNMEPGYYVLQETEAPEGYVVNSQPKTVEVKAGMTAKVTFEHDGIYGLQILTTVGQTKQPLAGAVYSIERLNGERVGTYTSDKQGLLYVTLEPDTYVVKQISLPDGYEADSAPRNVTVAANKTTTIEYVVGQLASMRIRIVDAATKKGIYNMRFLLKTQDGTLVGEYFTDDQGYARIDKELADGYYTLEAISAPDGYTLDGIPRTIQIRSGETTEVNWSFGKDAGQIQVVVRSTDYNQMLDLPAESLIAGATFEIINPDTYAVVDTMTSGADGVAASAPLPIGRYIVRQKSAAPYFAASDKEMEVKLKIPNDVVRVEYYNRSAVIALKHEMKSNLNVNAGSFMRVDFPKVNNESDSRLDDFYWQIKIPTDCARAGTLYTGSWNTRAVVKVFYKTNMQDFRQVSADMLSTNQNQLDLSSTALGLQTGEYVTDIRLSFGTVPANFAVNVKPALYLYVMPNVADGYKCIVRSEIGGKISNEWQTATATWTTNVINRSNLPGKLPTTGF